jgi:hypothetical protein
MRMGWTTRGSAAPSRRREADEVARQPENARVGGGMGNGRENREEEERSPPLSWSKDDYAPEFQTQITPKF